MILAPFSIRTVAWVCRNEWKEKLIPSSTRAILVTWLKEDGFTNSPFAWVHTMSIFFASIGIKVVLPKMTAEVIIFTVVIVLVAVLAKIIGCGIGAKLFRYSTRECLQIGAGMVSRGEVALVVMDKGGSALMPSNLQGPIVIMVVATTIIAPILLKIVFKERNEKNHKIA